jgi:catechol 2,3-dioxygenase-like lactoylglutathione lyase family enzyme
LPQNCKNFKSTTLGGRQRRSFAPRQEHEAMPRVAGIDHLVLSVGDFARSKEFYGKLLGFLGFKLKHDYDDMAGWSNGKTLFWIAAADAEGRKRKYRKGDIGFHHYAFEVASRKDIDALGAFLEKNDMTIVDPPGEYYGRDYYAVYFTDPDGMKLEGMIWAPPEKKRAAKAKSATRKRPKKKAKA